MRGIDGEGPCPPRLPGKQLGPGTQGWLGILCALSPWNILGHPLQCLLLWRLGRGLTGMELGLWAEGLSLDDGDLGSKLVDSHETPVTESGLGVWAWIWKNHKKSIEVEITPKTEVETPSVASFWKRNQAWEVMTP